MNNQINLKQFVPDNRGKGKRILGFRKRNWIEGLLESAVVIGIIFMIPFVLKLKFILSVIVLFFLMLFNLVGYRNRTWTELLILWMKYRSNKTSLKLRSPYEKNTESSNTKERNKYTEKIDQFLAEGEAYTNDKDIRRNIAKFAANLLRDMQDSFRD